MLTKEFLIEFKGKPDAFIKALKSIKIKGKLKGDTQIVVSKLSLLGANFKGSILADGDTWRGTIVFMSNNATKFAEYTALFMTTMKSYLA